MIEKGEVKAFAATVTEGAVAVTRGMQVTFSIPAMGKFPVKINEITQDEATRLTPGTGHTIMLMRGNQKKATDDGTQMFHYWWDWKGFAKEGTVPEAKQEAAAATNGFAERDRAIRRAVALKAAVDFWPHQGGPEKDALPVLFLADEFDAWLQAPQEGTQEPQEQAFEDLGNDPDQAVATVTDFWSAIHEEYGNTDAIKKAVVALFDGFPDRWLKKGTGRTWQTAWDHVRTTLKVE